MRKFALALFSALILFFPYQISAHSETQVIEMTADGFIPQKATVDVNSAVIFINKDGKAHWPASNTHPTHELYPEFDPKRAIAPGQSWAFKPKRAGVWKYHDHLSPHKRGLIIVASEKDQKETIEPSLGSVAAPKKENGLIKNIRNLADKVILSFGNLFKKENTKPKTLQSFNLSGFKKANYQKQEETAKLMAEELGAEKAWQNIKTAFKGESGSAGGIHDLTHLAGNLLYKEKGLLGLKFCSSEFAFGCYHGLLDEAFARSLNGLPEAEKACSLLGPKNSGPVASCIHGIGHGIASYYLTSDIKKSLSTCRKLTSGEEFCFDGVFMEFVRSAPISFYKEEDPLYPCDFLENQFGYVYSLSCGRNQPSLLMGRFKMSFEDTASVCVNSISEPFKIGCIDALGFHLAGTLDPEQIIGGCNSLGEFSNECIQKATGELVFQNSPLLI